MYNSKQTTVGQGGIMKRDEIINISLELFLAKGYEKTTISNIMKRAGLSKGGMYHHFSSKEEILEAVIRKAMDESEVNISKRLKETSSLEKKFALFFYFSELNSSYLNDFYAIMQKEKSSLFNYMLRDINRQYGAKSLAPIIYEGISNGVISCENVEKTAEILFNYGEDSSFRALNSENKKEFLYKEFESFIYFIEKLLSPSKEFLDKFYYELTLFN